MKINIQSPDTWNASAKKPFCTHCNNLNKQFQNNPPLPTNHWVRKSKSIQSPITCPEILKSLCSFCQKIGHTKQMCPEKRNPANIRKKINNNSEVAQELTDTLVADIFQHVQHSVTY